MTDEDATEHEIGVQQIIVEWMTQSPLTQKLCLNHYKIETENQNKQKTRWNIKPQSKVQKVSEEIGKTFKDTDVRKSNKNPH